MSNNTLETQKIKVLPDFIANQIAAGEVVQRPESVIKELVENSLDAGANSVAVIVKGAGKQLIHIVDNGSGMNRGDLELSVKRHATSKIKTQEDLERINTLGFRGEALASIASVAHLEIRSKTEEEEIGWNLISAPSEEIIIEPVATDTGTQVFVKNLFYNVPARRKFLRANLTEFRYISDTMIKFALCKHNVRFTFYDNENLVFDVKPASLKDRIAELLGNITTETLLEVSYENQLLKINGFIGKPEIAKRSRSGQYLFLNGRSIQSRSLSYSVFSSFEHLLEKSQHPIFVINIEIDPSNVDVNIHPQKHEVKFDDERYIYNSLRQAVSESLQRNDLTREINLREQDTKSPFELVKSGDDDGKEIIVNKLTGEIIETSKPSIQAGRSVGTTPQPVRHDYRSSQFSKEEINQRHLSAFDDLFGTGQPKEEFSVSAKADNQSNLPESMYWQMHNKYILVQTETGILVVDQHNAHERILFEKSIKAMNRELSNSQELLFPERFNFDSSQLTLLKELEDDLKNLGFSFDIIENNEDKKEVILTSVPLDVQNGEEKSSFIDILDLYHENQKELQVSKRESIAATFSCKAAIKTGQPLSYLEMKSLVERLLKCDKPYQCPHGRPVILEYSLAEFDKRFGRTS